MKKVIVTLHSGPAQSVDVPAAHEFQKGEKRALERTCFGSIRLFPGLPKVVSQDELDYILEIRRDLAGKVFASAYVESHRADKRGCPEAESPAKPERRADRQPSRSKE